VGQLVVDILGQQDNMRLLDPAQHLNYLDLFLTNHAPLEDVGRLFNAIMDVVRGIERRLESYHAARSSEDYLEFRARELSDFSPNLEDYEQALSLCERAGTLKAKQEFLSRAQAMIDEGANAEPLSLRVWDAVRTLEKLGDIGSIRPLIGMAQEAADLLDQLSFKLCQAASEVDFSEEDLGPANERIATYQDFFRKFGVTTVPDLVAEQERLSADLALLRNLASELAADISTLAASVKHLDQRSLDLSKERKKAAKTLSRRVETELGELNMPDSTFAVELTAVNRIPPSLDFKGLDPALSEAWTKLSPSLAACGESGRDKVQFLLSANKGEKPLPLQRTASGGELSRIMLAIKKALAAGAETCVLVFDEIDTGISGKTADIVGLKLKQLSRQFQVLCISHLAQVAAYADAHFRVEKMAKGARTESHIVRLSSSESAKEIARILSGTEITDPSIKNAKSLVERAKRASQSITPAERL
jgi:DNA repair protein RecN (Recombination protein N)